MSVNNSKSRRQRRNRPNNNSNASFASNALQQMKFLTDVGPALSDGSSTVLSDLTQMNMSGTVPTRVPRAINQQVVWHRATLDLQGNLSAVSETQLGIQFSLTQLPNYLSWTAIFDQYCIPCAVLQIRTSENVATDSGLGPMPRIWSALDHDDANAISVSAIRAYASCKEQRMVDSVTRIVYPRIATAAYSGAFTSFSNSRMWIDAGSPAVQHYGVKIAMEADTRVNVGEYLIRYTVYYAFRNHH
jgi:hypothetical protein